MQKQLPHNHIMEIEILKLFSDILSIIGDCYESSN